MEVTGSSGVSGDLDANEANIAEQPGAAITKDATASKLLRASGETHFLREGYGLTEREATVAKLLCLGYAPAQLALRLKVSTHTVRSHLKSIFSKTRTHRQADLVRLLLTRVFIAPPTE